MMPASGESLANAIQSLTNKEIASFHFPGHKNRFGSGSSLTVHDVTELPGLDDLSDPSGVLQNLSTKIARLWGSRQALLSVNGASAGNVACVLASMHRGSHVLLPRNAHRSLINALVISGLNPIWYEPNWDEQWGVWGEVSSEALQSTLEEAVKATAVSAIVLTSPTYTGAISDIAKIAELCHKHDVLLIVDEAHGAHLLPGTDMPAGAIECGADLVVHSMHKTLGALTQTGTVHIGHAAPITLHELQSAINLVQSSSPSYPLMASIENTVESLADGGSNGLVSTANNNLKQKYEFSQYINDRLGAIDGIEVYRSAFEQDPMHVLIKHDFLSAEQLQSNLIAQGIYPEAVLGNGLLLALGVGSNRSDADALLTALRQCVADKNSESRQDAKPTPAAEKPPLLEQVLSPRAAWLMPSRVVSNLEAEGQIVADYVAPCPPGIPICVPGQRLEKGVISRLPKFVRIVS